MKVRSISYVKVRSTGPLQKDIEVMTGGFDGEVTLKVGRKEYPVNADELRIALDNATNTKARNS